MIDLPGDLRVVPHHHLGAGVPQHTLRVASWPFAGRDAERPDVRSHAERGNEGFARIIASKRESESKQPCKTAMVQTSVREQNRESNHMKIPKNIGMLLLAIWLILYGLLTTTFLHFGFSHQADVLAILAIAAGVLLFLQR